MTKEAIFKLYSPGEGAKDLVDDLLGEGVGTRILCPNRMYISYLQDLILRTRGGYLGLEFLTFDDLAQSLVPGVKKTPREVLALILRDLILDKARFQLLEAGAFLETADLLLDFFVTLQVQDLDPGDLEALSSPLLREILALYQDYLALLQEAGLYDQGRLYREAQASLDQGEDLGGVYLYGFSDLGGEEASLLRGLLERAHKLKIYWAFGQEDLEETWEARLESLRDLGFQLEDHRKAPKSLGSLLAYYRRGEAPLDLEGLRLIEGEKDHQVFYDLTQAILALHLDKKLAFKDMVVYTTSSEDRDAYIDYLSSYPIPLDNPLGLFKAEDSQLLRDLRTCFLWQEEGQEGVFARLQTKYFSLTHRGEALERALKKIGQKDFKDLVQFVKETREVDMTREEWEDLACRVRDLEKDLGPEAPSFVEALDFFQRRLDQLDPEDLPPYEALLYQALKEVLEDLRAYSPWVHQVRREEFFDLLLKGLGRRELRAQFVPQGLSVLSLDQGVGQVFPAVFILGLDGSWPGLRSRSFLDQAGLKEDLKNLGYQDPGPMAAYDLASSQFYEALAGASQLVLAWTNQEGRGASPILKANPYLGEAIRLKKDQEGPKKDPIISRREDLYHYHISQGKKGPRLEEDPGWSRLEDRWALLARGQEEGAYRGQISGPALAQIQSSLKTRTFSASLLDAYLACPFKMYVDLFLAPQEESLGPKTQKNIKIGQVYHKVLEAYYRGGDLKEDRLEVLLDQAFSASGLASFYPGPEGDLVQSRMKAKLLNYLAQDRERLENPDKDQGFRPRLFEEGFFMDLAGVKWRGTLDRIDQNDQGEEILIDYKKSSAPSYKDFISRRVWQLALYGYARIQAGHPLRALYYAPIEKASANIQVMLRDIDHLGKYKGGRKERYRTAEEFEAFFKDLPQEVAKVLEKIQSGAFPAQPLDEGRCKNCPYKKICRLEERRPSHEA
ncbi:MAG: PD-(D/E)XK nuclease family protein [Tissierellia bacterium]|nr:PD-(D/E)XK nuclease family protein [Tissierellia bacterium]